MCQHIATFWVVSYCNFFLDSILVLDERWLLQVCLGKAFPPKHAFVDISVFLSSNARFAQGQPKKEFHRTTKAIDQMNTDGRVEKAQYVEFNVPTCGKIAVWQLCRERQPVWNSHDGLNLTCLHKLLPRLTPKNCYKVYSLNLIDEFISLFSPKGDCCRESFPHAFVDISVFLWLRTKILPRLAQGLFSNERTW